MKKWKAAMMNPAMKPDIAIIDHAMKSMTARLIVPGTVRSTRRKANLLRGALITLLLVCSGLACAADFSLQDIQGKTHRLADYRGKWVLVNFWATWCPPCLKEIPELVSLHDAHHDKDLLVIGIAMDSGSKKQVAKFARAHGISYPVVMGDRRNTAQFGVLEILPVSYLYNPGGEQVSYQEGEVTRASVEAYINKK